MQVYGILSVPPEAFDVAAGRRSAACTKGLS